MGWVPKQFADGVLGERPRPVLAFGVGFLGVLVVGPVTRCVQRRRRLSVGVFTRCEKLEGQENALADLSTP